MSDIYSKETNYIAIVSAGMNRKPENAVRRTRVIARPVEILSSLRLAGRGSGLA
jgi:hypothetical protein